MHTHRTRSSRLGTALALSAAIGVWAICDAQSLRWLGTFPNGTSSKAYDVSDDGAVVVGSAVKQSGRVRAFRWTASNNQMQDLGSFRDDTLLGGNSEAFGVSANGGIVVGYSDTNSSLPIAFGWPGRNNQLLNLGHLGGGSSIAYAIVVESDRPNPSAFAVGWATNSAGDWRAFLIDVSRQNQTMQDLGTLGGRWSAAYDISEDGQVIVGQSVDREGNIRAFRWQNNVMTPLSARGADSVAYGVSGDGSVIVGTVYPDPNQRRPAQWDRNGFAILDTPNDSEGEAYDVSTDGAVIVGWSSYSNDSKRASRWTSRGYEDLNQTYASLLRDGSILQVAHAVSANGRYVVGWGYNAATERVEAFLLDTGDSTGCVPHNGDVDNNGCVDDADLLQVLFAFGQTGQNLGRVDANCDQTVDDADLLLVLFSFGVGC